MHCDHATTESAVAAEYQSYRSKLPELVAQEQAESNLHLNFSADNFYNIQKNKASQLSPYIVSCISRVCFSLTCTSHTTKSMYSFSIFQGLTSSYLRLVI